MTTKKINKNIPSPKAPVSKSIEKPTENIKREKPTADATKTNASPRTLVEKSAEKKSFNIFMVIILLIIAGGIYVYQKGYVTQYFPIAKSKFVHHSPLNSDDAFAKIQQETQGLTPPQNPKKKQTFKKQ